MDVGQVGNGVAAEANGAPISAGAALAGKRQFYGFGGAGRDAGDVGNMVAAQQPHQSSVAVHRRLQDVLLFVPSEVHDTFGDIANLNGFECLQDLLVVNTEL
ncbi:hypothetical protein D3C73_1486830 [compost metagenome]